MALLQKIGVHTVRREHCRRFRASSRLWFESFTEDCDGLREGAGTEAKSPLDNARLTADVSREIEDLRLALA